MKTILVGSTEIEVVSFNAYTYNGGMGEKVLQFKIAAENVTFETLKETLDNNEQPIRYMEDDTLVCEYVGYGVFEAKYSNGVYEVELHKTSIVEQMNALLNANERLNLALNALDEANGKAAATIAMLEEQNAMLEMCILEISEIIYA